MTLSFMADHITHKELSDVYNKRLPALYKDAIKLIETIFPPILSQEKKKSPIEFNIHYFWENIYSQ